MSLAPAPTLQRPSIAPALRMSILNLTPALLQWLSIAPVILIRMSMIQSPLRRPRRPARPSPTTVKIPLTLLSAAVPCRRGHAMMVLKHHGKPRGRP